LQVLGYSGGENMCSSVDVFVIARSYSYIISSGYAESS